MQAGAGSAGGGPLDLYPRLVVVVVEGRGLRSGTRPALTGKHHWKALHERHKMWTANSGQFGKKKLARFAKMPRALRNVDKKLLKFHQHRHVFADSFFAAAGKDVPRLRHHAGRPAVRAPHGPADEIFEFALSLRTRLNNIE